MNIYQFWQYLMHSSIQEILHTYFNYYLLKIVNQLIEISETKKSFRKSLNLFKNALETTKTLLQWLVL
jgi:hypothetical protein